MSRSRPNWRSAWQSDIASRKIKELRSQGKVELFDPDGKPLAMAAPPKTAAPAEAPKPAQANNRPGAARDPGATRRRRRGRRATLAPGTAPDQLKH